LLFMQHPVKLVVQGKLFVLEGLLEQTLQVLVVRPLLEL
jgi:hypothetical protein